LDSAAFADALSSARTQAELLKDITFARQLPIQGFPSLVLAHKGTYYPIRLDYHSAETSLKQVREILSGSLN